MGSKCAMNMIWNTQIIGICISTSTGSTTLTQVTSLLDTCIVFPQWHITSNASFVLSFFVVVGLGVAYEWLRDFQRRVDLRVARSLRAGLTSTGPSAVSGASTSRAPSEEDRLLIDNVKGRKTYASFGFLPEYCAR
jgi:copper transporter 1